MLLFVSHYPDEDSVKDGMSQRIVNVDNFFKTDERIYLDISLRRFPKIKYNSIGKLSVLECNFFLHFFTIYRLFKKANKIYFHSVLNVLNGLIFCLLIKREIILDLHGVVPEEFKMNGKKLCFIVFKFCEIVIFRKAKIAICVSENMKKFYQKSYPKSLVKFLIYPILPNTLTELIDINKSWDNSSTVNFIYSGNTQKWQNVELMIDIISRNLKNNFVFYILTRNKSEMINLFKQKIDLNANNQIIIESVSPEQLDGYYQKCHYGFILREDVLVNNVACPTKLVEYLYYGIVPIVLSPNIGDFEALNYDYIYYDQLADSLLPLKSNNNNLIVRNLLQRNNEFNFRNKVLMS